jgi:hypothetical protein
MDNKTKKIIINRVFITLWVLLTLFGYFTLFGGTNESHWGYFILKSIGTLLFIPIFSGFICVLPYFITYRIVIEKIFFDEHTILPNNTPWSDGTKVIISMILYYTCYLRIYVQPLQFHESDAHPFLELAFDSLPVILPILIFNRIYYFIFYKKRKYP